jgi:hypothetical protein
VKIPAQPSGSNRSAFHRHDLSALDTVLRRAEVISEDLAA